MKRMRVVFFLFLSTFCSESESDSNGTLKEKIKWDPLIKQIQQDVKITSIQERAFREVKIGVRCFLGTTYDPRTYAKETSSDDDDTTDNTVDNTVLHINENGALECVSFIGIIQAILFCRTDKKLRDIWKSQTTTALDAATSGILISRKDIPDELLKQADKILQNRTFPIITTSGEFSAVQDSEGIILSRMASVQPTPVSSPERPASGTRDIQEYFKMPSTGHIRTDSGSFAQ